VDIWINVDNLFLDIILAAKYICYFSCYPENQFPYIKIMHTGGYVQTVILHNQSLHMFPSTVYPLLQLHW